MKIAVITDIHGNIDALNKALELIDTLDVDRIICLGDIIGKGTDDISCLNAIINRGIETVSGNWEAYINRGIENFMMDIKDFDSLSVTKDSLTSDQLNWIQNLPFELVVETSGKRILFMHYIIKDLNDSYPYYSLKTLENGDFQRLIKDYDYDYMFFGHRHYERYIDNAVIVPSLGLEKHQFMIISINDNSINTEIFNV